MKPAFLNAACILSMSLASTAYGQPGDPVHPAHTNKTEVVYTSVTSVKKTNPVILYDGINLFDNASLGKIDPHTIDKKRSELLVVNYSGKPDDKNTIEIFTLEGNNAALKHLMTKTNYWIKEHPFAVFYLDGTILSDDESKLSKLKTLKLEQIKEVRVLSQQEGEKLLGATGKNGVIVVNTR